jgi:6-phosphogluconolactonase (cycloisomerase 2 family)
MENGCLVEMSSPVKAGTHSISMSFSPSGAFAYVVNQNSNNISQFQLADDGSLLPLQIPSVAVDLTPVGLSVSGSGKFAYVCNISSNNITQFSVSEAGELLPILVNNWGDATIAAGVSPRCVVTA